MKGKLQFLGTGGSIGVPVIGCTCDVCTSSCQYNVRLRPSACVDWGGRRFLIDVGPDFKQQALRYHITRLDGILLTHAHRDHVAGIDDLRSLYYYTKRPLPILLSEDTANDVKMRYDYLFKANEERVYPTSFFTFQILPNAEGEIIFEEIAIQYVTYIQGAMKVNGYRLGNLAYLSDIRYFNPSIFKQLKGLKYLVISALRHEPSLMHFSIEEAIHFANELQVECAWLTHISHDLDHEKTNVFLPPHIQIAYDGLEIEFE
jgi:phosphoribosyl 1,2-cyclic phosphate phosphodiesterase